MGVHSMSEVASGNVVDAALVVPLSCEGREGWVLIHFGDKKLIFDAEGRLIQADDVINNRPLVPQRLVSVTRLVDEFTGEGKSLTLIFEPDV